MQRRTMLKGLGVLAIATPIAGWMASAGAKKEEENEFLTLPQVIPGDGVPAGKIEVIEFFHFGCPHCRQFESTIAQWSKSLPEDVYFHRVPVTWNSEGLTNLARVYYSLNEAKLLDQLSERVFNAVQKERIVFESADVLRDWAAKQEGIDDKAAQSLADMYGSFGMGAMLDRGRRIERAYGVRGVPMIAVGGRYTTSGDQVKNHTNEAMLPVVDALIERLRGKKK